MSFTRIAVATVVVCLTAATFADAQGRRHGRGRRNDARPIIRSRVVVRPPVVVPRHAVPARVAPYGHHYAYRGRLAYRPVYRPRLGFGIYIGAPHLHVAYGRPLYARPYPYPYGYFGGYAVPYAYPYPPAYAYPPHAGVYAVPPANALYGGVRLEVTPRDAAVYVDGYYAGIVEDFDGTWERVALEPGPHRFEIVAPGHETLTFEVNVRANEVIRYRGDMLRAVP